MGAYSTNHWPAPEMWKQAVRKKQKLILSPQYVQAMYDECIIAVVFGYSFPLLEKILLYSFPSEHESVLSLFRDEVDIMFNNGNMIISN